MDENLQDITHGSGRNKIPMDLTLAEALRLSWSGRRLFGRFMIIPVAMATVLGLASLAFYNESDQTASRVIWSFGIFIPDFLVLTWFAVACHRLILIGGGAVSEFGLTRWTWRETQFFLWMLLAYIVGLMFAELGITAIALVVSIISTALGSSLKGVELMMGRSGFIWMLVVFSLVFFAYWVGRLSLVLPATAIDLRPTLRSVSVLSTENGWRVAILVGGVPIAFMAIQSLIWMIPSWLFGESLQETQSAFSVTSIGLTFVQSTLRYIFATVEIAILSITFRRLKIMEERKLASPPAT